MSAQPLPPGRVRPAFSPINKLSIGDEPTLTVTQLAPGHWVQYRVNEHTVDWRYVVDTGPAPSAGQDTERLRDELVEALVGWVIAAEDYYSQSINEDEASDITADVLALPALRQLVAERDEARAQVQRVELLLRNLFAAVERGDEYGLPEAYRAAAKHLRALDDPEHSPDT